MSKAGGPLLYATFLQRKCALCNAISQRHIELLLALLLPKSILSWNANAKSGSRLHAVLMVASSIVK